MDPGICLQAIGVERTAHTELVATPIQAGLNRAGQGTIEIGNYRDGLAGLAGFDYAITPAQLTPSSPPA